MQNKDCCGNDDLCFGCISDYYGSHVENFAIYGEIKSVITWVANFYQEGVSEQIKTEVQGFRDEYKRLQTNFTN